MSVSSRIVGPGLAGLAALVVSGSLAVTAVAQQAPAPVREVQGSDGTLYILQGGNSWTFVPDQISDSDVAALNPSGEIDGTFPTQLFVVQAPVAATAPAAPAPAAPLAVGAAPITGKADLTGKAGVDVLTATAIAPGATITSVVDHNTKPNDYFSITLAGGTKYGIFSSSNNKYNGAGVILRILNPDASLASADNTLGGWLLPGCSSNAQNDTCFFTPAIDGTYYLQFVAQNSGQNYTFTFK